MEIIVLLTEFLQEGKYLESTTGRYRLKLQVNGNLEIFCQNVSIWETKTVNDNVDFLYFDPNGNLVLFGIDESVIWAAGIAEHATTCKMMVIWYFTRMTVKAFGLPAQAINVMQTKVLNLLYFLFLLILH